MTERSEPAADTAQPLAHGGRMDSATEAFLAHRSLLFTVAYLDSVRDQRAYLVRIATRQALTRLRTLRRRKESYVGPWLPEPPLTAPDVAEDVELADSVSIAMLLVLETLTPRERAVFVLREVFDREYHEIAEAVDKSPGAVRQIAHRARAHVAARRPRAGRAGYFGQAHFGHEFRTFTGLTPTRYVDVRRRFLREHPGHALDVGPLPAD